MITRITATTLALVLGLPMAAAHAQTNPPAASAQEHDAHHPAGQEATQPAMPTPQPATPGGTAGAAPTQAQMGMMMGDMRQMMGMMRQMMGMMGGGMPMMGMMGGQQGRAGPGPMAGRPGGGEMPGMFRHTEGTLAFYKAELRVTAAQEAQWNTFAEAVRSHVKTLREAMQRVATQRAGAPAPEQLDQRVALLTAQLDAAKAVSAAGKALYAALSPEQRKLADTFLADHMRAMRGPMP